MRDTPKYSMGQIRNNNENEKIFKLKKIEENSKQNRSLKINNKYTSQK